jgi:hypothetical protein
MKRILILLLTFVCAGMLWAAWSKSRQLGELRVKESEMLASSAASSDNSAPSIDTSPGPSNAQPAENPNTPEVLRLRAEVSRLMRRKQELSGAVAENQKLKSQVAAIGSNSQSNLPNDYLRKANAQNRGYATPQATIETFFWAVQSTNMNNVLETFTPETASEVQQTIRDDPQRADNFFKEFALPGYRILRTEPIGPDHVRLLLEIVPGIDPMPIDAKLINGQWKLGMPR